MRYLIKFSYDGSNYIGYQTQPEHDTIQKKIEDALTTINKNKPTKIIATGRTDKGVHALCQYGHADLDIEITEHKLKRAMNSNTPDDIHIISTQKVSEDFHARYNVKSKEYRYYINLDEYNPIERKYVFQYNHNLNISAMERAIKYFIGEHDFRAFVTENKEKENCVRSISVAKIEKVAKNKICMIFKGNGFLRYQVRNMVGILISVGEERIKPEKVLEILESKDRTENGKTAPSVGLYLTEVIYDNNKIKYKK